MSNKCIVHGCSNHKDERGSLLVTCVVKGVLTVPYLKVWRI